MTRYRQRTRTPDLPPLLRRWQAGEAPPDDYTPTPAELEQVRDACMFGDYFTDAGRRVALRSWQDHPARGAWLAWRAA